MTKFALYWHTLKYLKPVQFWYRIWFKLYRPSIVSFCNIPVRSPVSNWQVCPRAPSLISHNSFRFLNDSRAVEFPQAWSDESLSALWLYNLHYFDDLNAVDSELRRDSHADLLARWISDNPSTRSVGWDSYPTSLRLVNWIKWQLAGGAGDAAFLDSLVMQASWLSRRIEYHLQANHLWANGKALLFAATFFEGELAGSWRKQSEQLLREQLREQILDDGGHFERSPMYHAIILEDLLDIIQLSSIYPKVLRQDLVSECKLKVHSMFIWLSALTHPDGGLSFFNDSTNGVASKLEVLKIHAKAIGMYLEESDTRALSMFADSGYVRVENTNVVLLCDVGELGPDFQPGHGHADTLSCEVSLFGERFIVNSGIDRYELDEARLHQRSTAAHSTVEVDGESSSEVWGGFRVARRARPVGLKVRENSDRVTVSCAHDGYLRLPGNVAHTREWVVEDKHIFVKDSLAGSWYKAVSRFYLHPSVEVISASTTSCELRHRQNVVHVNLTGGELSVQANTYHSGFGISEDNQCLLINFDSSTCEVRFTW